MPMHPLLAALVPLAASFPLVAGQQAAQPATTVDVLSIRTDQHDRMTVPVRIADKGPFRFLIDTGAQNTVLSTSLAGQLDLGELSVTRTLKEALGHCIARVD